MLKKLNIRLIRNIAFWTVGILILCVLTNFVLAKAGKQVCKEVKIIIPGANNLVERQDIDLILEKTSGQLIGRNLGNINLYEIEKKLEKNPYISQAKVFADIDGVIHIDILQKEPILRIINKWNQDFYIDSEGKKMPVSTNFTPRVLVANGNINERLNKQADTLNTVIGKDLFKVATFIKSNPLWNAQIEQLYLDENQNIVMIPRVGNQTIILGNADSVAVKFNKLLIFYKKAMPKVGWNTYKTINLKFSRQIVAVKSDSLKVMASNFKKEKDLDKLRNDLIKQEIEKNLIH